MRKTVPLALVLALAGLIALPQGRDVTHLEREVERLRGLKFQKKVDVQIEDGAQLRRVLQNKW